MEDIPRLDKLERLYAAMWPFVEGIDRTSLRIDDQQDLLVDTETLVPIVAAFDALDADEGVPRVPESEKVIDTARWWEERAIETALWEKQQRESR
jgi:hypothetical protein